MVPFKQVVATSDGVQLLVTHLLSAHSFLITTLRGVVIGQVKLPTGNDAMRFVKQQPLARLQNRVK